MSFDRGLAVRAGLIQLAAVLVVFIPLAVALPESFFEDWGWLVGPIAWIACAMLTGRVLRLDPSRTFAAALLAAVPSVIGVLVDAHQVGGIVAVLCFGLLCGLIPAASAGARHR